MSRQRTIRSFRPHPKVRADDPEPSLCELLDDPVLQTLMSRDGVARAALLDIVADARLRLGINNAPASPCSLSAFEATLFAECRA